MPTENSFQLAGSSERPQMENTIDLKKVFRRVISKWYYFLFAIVIALICAFLYNTYTIPTYRVSTTLLINEAKKGGVIENNQFLDGLGLSAGTQNLDNQIAVLSSKTLIGRTLDELPFYIEYYYRRLNNKVSLYPYSPIKVILEITDSLPRDIEFYI